jgi:alpha-tubulin suppressor-like RCC1 family protein
MKKSLYVVFALLISFGCDETTSPADTCGDGVIDVGEDCDGSNMANHNCVLAGYYDGTMACTSFCKFDETNCLGKCGDNIINSIEECDGSDLGNKTCDTEGYISGPLRCTQDCKLDISECSGICGDGLENPQEECDGENLFGAQCHTADPDYHEGYGTLSCNDTCGFETSDCVKCGDSEINGPEECDGLVFDEINSCNEVNSMFYAGMGTLACVNCSFDTGGCFYCGDDILHDAETCDTNVFSDSVVTCGESGFAMGFPACASDCNSVDHSSCTHWTSVASGTNHTCAIDADGSVWCWGMNDYGQLGDGTDVYKSHPQKVTALPGIATKIAVGGITSCAISDSGKVFCWGKGTDGQLGNGASHDSDVPVQAASSIAGSWQDISVGSIHTCGVVNDFHGTTTAYCWGMQYEGRLGNGATALVGPTPFPQEVKKLSSVSLANVQTISSGHNSSCAVTSNFGNNEIYCWGKNDRNQLGDNSGSSYQPYAVNVAINTDADSPNFSGYSVSVGNSFVCAIDMVDHAYCWGANDVGQLGIKTYDDSEIPVRVKLEDPNPPFNLLFPVDFISTGDSHSCAIRPDGLSYCWGENNGGQFGIDSTVDYFYAISSMANVLYLDTGSDYTCSVDTEGRLFCYGLGDSYQLGNGTNLFYYNPEMVTIN